MAGRTVLVTGAAGFIGSALVGALLRLGCDVAAVDRDHRGLKQFALLPGTDRLTIFRTDITDKRAIVDAVTASSPTAIVHLAALHLIPACEAQPRRTVDVNIDGFLNLLDAADHSRTEFMLFASSADVYDASAEPLAETDPARPCSVYGASKLLGERLLAEWAERRPGRRATSVRIFNVYGPGDSNPHIVPDILASLRDGNEVRVGSVETRRDFIHVDDLVDVLCQILECAEPPSVLNAGTGLATSITELLGVIQGLIGRPVTWSSDAAKVRANDRFCLQADTSRLRAAFPGFDPRSLETGLSDLLQAAGVQLGELSTVA